MADTRRDAQPADLKEISVMDPLLRNSPSPVPSGLPPPPRSLQRTSSHPNQSNATTDNTPAPMTDTTNRSANQRCNHRRQRSATGKRSADPDIRPHESFAGPAGSSSSLAAIQFTLGDADEAPDDPDHVGGMRHHPLFCEMEELKRAKDGTLEWKETARWVRYEEDVEEFGNRFSKPFVATLQLHALLGLRTYLSQAVILLDADVPALPPFCDLIIDEWINKSHLPEYQRDLVRDILLRRHRHQFECDHKAPFALRQLSGLGRSISHSIFNFTHHEPLTTVPDGGRRSSQTSKIPKVTSASSVWSSPGSDTTLIRNSTHSNFTFAKKLPPDAESATILVGEVEFIIRPVCAFVRMRNDICLGNLTEVNVPTRFVFVLLVPLGTVNYHEVGRSMGVLCSDGVFQQQLYKAKSRHCIPEALENFLNEVTVIPPGEWDPQIRIEPPKTLLTQEHRKRSPNGSVIPSPVVEDEKELTTVRRTGRICGGLIDDIKCKSRYYVSDFRDGLALQCLAAAVFLYFATLTPIIAFGAVLGDYTDNNMAAMESLLSAAFVGILWAFFSGQPLIIMGSTGPVLIFESIITRICKRYDYDYLPVRFWIGIWSGSFLLIMVATDASYLVRYITRFTEEGFAALISFIFIYEAIEKLLAVRAQRNICTYPMECPGVYTSPCACNFSGEILELSPNVSRSLCIESGGSLIGSGCPYVPDVFFLSIILFIGTFFLAAKMKKFRTQPFFPTKFRQVVSDFGVTASIIIMTLFDACLGLDTPKLLIPAGLSLTLKDRSWFIHPFQRNPGWTAIAAAVPALFAVILIFMDQQITAVIVNRSENKLRKGCGYHLDLLVLATTVIVCAVLGLPWMVAATVLSINHVNSLKEESESRAPGEAPQFIRVRENRLTTLCIYLLIGASVFMRPILSRIPMPVLYGVFMFMGVSALRGLQFVDRLCILLMPSKHQPDYIYIRHVPIKRIHLFTFIQIVCLALLWVLKSYDDPSLLFPVMVVALVGVRKLMDFIFTQRELALLDDLMPEPTRRRKDDEKVVLTGQVPRINDNSTVQMADSPLGQVICVPLPNGHIIKIPKSTDGSTLKSESIRNGQASPLLVEHVDENAVKLTRSPRLSRSAKKAEPSAHSVIMAKPSRLLLSNPRHGQIPEEGTTPTLSHNRSPVITICPATPTQTVRGLRSAT